MMSDVYCMCVTVGDSGYVVAFPHFLSLLSSIFLSKPKEVYVHSVCNLHSSLAIFVTLYFSQICSSLTDLCIFLYFVLYSSTTLLILSAWHRE